MRSPDFRQKKSDILRAALSVFRDGKIPQMRILVNGVFGRNYRFVEVNVAIFVNKTINLTFGSGESFDFTLLFDRLLQSIQIMAFQKLLHRSPVFDVDALTF